MTNKYKFKTEIIEAAPGVSPRSEQAPIIVLPSGWGGTEVERKALTKQVWSEDKGEYITVSKTGRRIYFINDERHKSATTPASGDENFDAYIAKLREHVQFIVNHEMARVSEPRPIPVVAYSAAGGLALRMRANDPDLVNNYFFLLVDSVDFRAIANMTPADFNEHLKIVADEQIKLHPKGGVAVNTAVIEGCANLNPVDQVKALVDLDLHRGAQDSNSVFSGDVSKSLYNAWNLILENYHWFCSVKKPMNLENAHVLTSAESVSLYRESGGVIGLSIPENDAEAPLQRKALLRKAIEVAIDMNAPFFKGQNEDGSDRIDNDEAFAICERAGLLEEAGVKVMEGNPDTTHNNIMESAEFKQALEATPFKSDREMRCLIFIRKAFPFAALLLKQQIDLKASGPEGRFGAAGSPVSFMAIPAAKLQRDDTPAPPATMVRQ